MGFEIVVPDSVFGGWYKRVGNWAFGLLAHTLQCNQRWLFLIRWNQYKFGYRTYGEATRESRFSARDDGGWHWPWQTNRWFAGRG